MPQYVFGTGELYTIPVAGGVARRFGALQDVSVDFSSDIKQLFGQYQFPLDVARGKTKIEGTAKTGEVDVEAFNSFYFGQTVVAGQTLRVPAEAQAVPASPGPYTVTADEAATFQQDLGVVYAATGVAFVRVTSAPTVGQYSVNESTGVYTFAAADEGEAVLLSYLYDDAATGERLDIGNPLMGSTPKFRLVLSQEYGGKTFTLIFFSCTAGKLSLPLKQDDYLIGDLSFQAQANDQNRIGYMTSNAT